MEKFVFIHRKEKEAPLWMRILRAILILACIALTFAIVTIYANVAKADYSYQSYFSQWKDIFTDCVNKVVKVTKQIWTIDNSSEINATEKEIARLEELLSRLQVKNDALHLEHWQPIYWTEEIASQECTERVVEKPYCGDGIVNQKSEQCDWSANCSSSCTCNVGYLLMSTNSCQAIPMSEEEQPELMRTGASVKKEIKKK